MKNGWKTTEFWVSVSALVAGVIASTQGFLPPEAAAWAGAIIAGLYAFSRGLAKQGQQLYNNSYHLLGSGEITGFSPFLLNFSNQ